MLTDLLTSNFDFDLPPERIAQTAVEPRDHARLLHVTGAGLGDHHVYDLPHLLRAGDLLVMNDTKVIPARLFGSRGEVKVEVLLHKKQSPSTWLAFARPGKRLKAGDTILFAKDFFVEVLEKHEDGEISIRFNAGDQKLLSLLEQHGEPPLPPYIHREDGAAKQDSGRYQTIYAKHEGAVAAPTAGLHFTPELLARLAAKGIQQTTVTLHVGAGTFLPVKAERIADHKMHAEWGEVTAKTAALINQAKREGRRIVAVGTTSLRLLESAADDQGAVHPFNADTAIFIYPGFRFKAVDVLMTNFHLPKSTLFMLVSAFAGLERMREAYHYAVAKNYRFYSYGDATLLEKS
jgi:S-adenosylmethionine:tRNA ribosyltransferase-isomerase